MKVFVLVTCCVLSLVIGISDSRNPYPVPYPVRYPVPYPVPCTAVPCKAVPCTPALTARQCSMGKVYATCYMRQRGDDDSREDSRGDDDDDDDVGDDDGRGNDDGRDYNRGSRNASRRRGDDDGGDDDDDGGIRGSVFFSQKVDYNCNPLEELKVRVRIRGLGGDDDDDDDDDDNRRGDDDDNGGEECDDEGCRRTRLHGIHIHKFGDLRNKCLAAGPHYNPTGQDHGDRRGSPRHLGDMGNVRSNRYGRIRHNFRVEETSIMDIVGRSVVLHSGRDDLGRGRNRESRRTGNSGRRLACCVIGFADPKNTLLVE